MSEWISVNERMPPDWEDVIFFLRLVDNNKTEKAIGHYGNGYWHQCFLYSSNRLGKLVDVTHWMPLPSNPKE